MLDMQMKKCIPLEQLVQMNAQLMLNGCVVTKKQGHTQWPYRSFQYETSSCVDAIVIILF
jgi:hypothetical protein